MHACMRFVRDYAAGGGRSVNPVSYILTVVSWMRCMCSLEGIHPYLGYIVAVKTSPSVGHGLRFCSFRRDLRIFGMSQANNVKDVVDSWGGKSPRHWKRWRCTVVLLRKSHGHRPLSVPPPSPWLTCVA